MHPITAAFDALTPGQRFRSAGRTLTPTDLSFSCMLSGDWHPIHADVEYCRAEMGGERLLHGSFGIMLAMGMATMLPMFAERVIGATGLREWRFAKPLCVGDTVYVDVVVHDKRITSDGARAIVERRLILRNQRGDVVQEGIIGTMIQLGTQDESRSTDRT